MLDIHNLIDLEEFRVSLQEQLTDFCKQTKLMKCQGELNRLTAEATYNCGQLTSKLWYMCNQDGRTDGRDKKSQELQCELP